MQRKLIALTLVAAFAAPAFAEEAAPAGPHTFTGNVGLVTDYIFRGISQSQHNPAVQGGFDYSHSSGLYAGVWGSNVSWVDRSDYSYKKDVSLELDFYAGYKGAVGPVNYDLGVLRYYYPGNGVPSTGGPGPDSTEVYAGLGWSFLTFKYSQTVSDNLFGWYNFATSQKSKGSQYYDLTASYSFDGGWGVLAHVGRQKIKNYSPASYTDWKIGVTKDVGFGVVGLSYTDTNAKFDSATIGTDYNWNGEDVGKGRLVASFSKTF